jgi:hypothetical protein
MNEKSETFPSHSSSPSKASLGIEATRRLHISITSAIHTDSQNPFRWRAHGSHMWLHLLSLLKSVLPVFSQRSTRRTSAPLRVRIMSSLNFQPVSTPLQDGNRFFHHFSPYLLQHALRLACLRGRGMRLPRSAYLTPNTIGPLYLPVGVSPESELLQSLRATHLPFGSSLTAPLAC